MTKFSLLTSLSVCVFGLVSQVTSAATVEYSGSVFSLGGPADGSYVVAGTFAPGYKPFSGSDDFDTYSNSTLYEINDLYCVYAATVFDCNIEAGAYDTAVSDGIFTPIGLGTLTDQNGFFSTSGTTDAPAGTPIWLFAFEGNDTDAGTQVLASSTDSTWLIPAQPAGVTTLVAGNADLFLFGVGHPQGVVLTGVPIPEPTSLVLSFLGGLAILGSRRRR